jgi:ferredoxin
MISRRRNSLRLSSFQKPLSPPLSPVLLPTKDSSSYLLLFTKHRHIPFSLTIFAHQKIKVMAIMITDECINCGACEPECPNNAIYEGGAEWNYADGTSLKGMITTLDGNEVLADDRLEPINMDVYYITHDKCTECVGFHDEPQCAAVCPVDCCVDDPDYRESEDELLAKKDFMHL